MHEGCGPADRITCGRSPEAVRPLPADVPGRPDGRREGVLPPRRGDGHELGASPPRRGAAALGDGAARGRSSFPPATSDASTARITRSAIPPRGRPVSEEELAGIMLELEARGCHNIEPVTPTPHLPGIMAALRSPGSGGSAFPSSSTAAAMNGRRSSASSTGWSISTCPISNTASMRRAGASPGRRTIPATPWPPSGRWSARSATASRSRTGSRNGGSWSATSSCRGARRTASRSSRLIREASPRSFR